MAPRGKKKAIDTGTNSRIDSYFKPLKETEISVKRKLADTDENSVLTNDEIKKRTPSPPNSQPLKSQELKKLPLADVDNKNKVRIPLMDKNPNKSLEFSQKSRKSKLKDFIQPTFAVLCDEDIERGIERAETPPIVSHLFRDDSFLNDSQENTPSSFTASPEQQQELNTQFISEGDINTQFTATTSSPVPFDLYDDDEYDKNSKPFEIYKDENNEDSQPFEVYKDENNEDSQPFEVYKDENEDDYKPFEVYRDEDDSKSCTINTINNNKPFTCIREDNKENEPLSIDNNENDALSEDLDSDINIPQTKDTAVALKSNKETKSFDDFSFFGEVDDEGSNTNSTYFDLEKERENGEQGNNFDVFTDLDGDFSVGELASTDEAFSICIDTKNKDSLQDYTLSPEIQTLSQVHVPLPNPRGKDILEKLNIESINDSKQKLEVDNEDDVDDDDDDGLPLFN